MKNISTITEELIQLSKDFEEWCDNKNHTLGCENCKLCIEFCEGVSITDFLSHVRDKQWYLKNNFEGWRVDE